MIEQPDDAASRVPAVAFGPANARLPERFTGRVDYTERPLRVRLACSFAGADRVKVEEVRVDRTDGQTVTPEDMTLLQLGQVVHAVTMKAMRGVAMRGGRKHDGPPTDDELLMLARMYWQEYVAWGKPRQFVMSMFELPRSTANSWIRKARERHGLPGPHAEEDGRA